MVMMWKAWIFRAFAMLGLLFTGSASAEVATLTAFANCESMSGLTIAAAKITAVSREQGRFVNGGVAFPDLPAFCRVKGRIDRSDGGHIELEVWLPDKWNGRYLQTGNGGFAGSIVYRGLVYGLRNGFAVASSDGGHQSTGSDMRWAIDRPGRIADFGHLALRDTAIAAKAIIARHYGRAATRAYFCGCSDGGREALMSLQRYPEQFDGWLVGAPENDFTGELTAELVLAQASRGHFASITGTQLRAWSDFAIRSCDMLDGAKDGVIEDPRRCQPDIASLSCARQMRSGCLHAGQIAAIERVRAGWLDPSGAPVIPGLALSIGTEAAAGQWARWMSNVTKADVGDHEDFAQQFFGTFLYRDPGLNLTSLDPGVVWRDARRRIGADVDAVDTDLSRQRALQRKVIQYHGWSDIGIPAQFSLAYYQVVQKAMGGPIEDFYRLFMVPGMEHCAGGTGVNTFGGFADLVTPFDPDRHLLAALVRWVERGQAPDRIVATRYRDNEPIRGIERTRPLCVFPRAARYDRKGEISDAASFDCR